jgi:hypothetical protein
MKKRPGPALSFSGTTFTASNLHGEGGLMLSIFSIDGKLIQTYKTLQRSVELREIIKNKGVYLVSASAGEERITTKFIRTEK